MKLLKPITTRAKCCITCHNFSWWDGDYTCVEHFKILCQSPKGEMNEDILTAIEQNKKCTDYKKAYAKNINLEINIEAYNDFVDRYNKEKIKNDER